MIENLAANWPYLILMGLTGGFASALLGIGGGVVMVPMLVILAAAPQREAQGMCLGYMVITTLAGLLFYKYNEGVPINLKAVGLLTVGGIVGALIGAKLASHVPQFWLRKIFALVMVVAAFKFFLERPKPNIEKPDPSDTSVATTPLQSTPPSD